jgi:hypothetical protein
VRGARRCGSGRGRRNGSGSGEAYIPTDIFGGLHPGNPAGGVADSVAPGDRLVAAAGGREMAAVPPPRMRVFME